MADLIEVEELARLITQDNAVLLVGSQLRMEPGAQSLENELAATLAARLDTPGADRSLAEVASDFETRYERPELLKAIQEALRRLDAEPTPIHQLTVDALIPGTKVVTTRFDRLLERTFEQFHKPYVLIVRDTDLPFFDESRITLIKLQGDIEQPDTLVITEDDINDFIDKLPTVSDVVRAFFATKTLIFLGYDLDSPQFKRLYRKVGQDLKGYRRPAYAVTASDPDPLVTRYWEQQGVQICVREPLPFLEALAGAVKALQRSPVPAPNPLATQAQPPLPSQPYKALESYDAMDVAIFKGRSAESQQLANRILANPMTVLYGESGSGKTSLLDAGARPMLAAQRALLAVATPAAGVPLTSRLAASLAGAAERAGLQPPAASGLLPDMIRQWQRELDGPVVLALDQFEQFALVYGSDAQQGTLTDLARLLEDRSLFLRLVIVIREDFLGRLQTLEPQLPGLMDVRFRLERLGREAAAAAIVEPAALFGVRWEPAVVDVLLDGLYDHANGGVAPPQLQITCDRLFRAAIALTPIPGDNPEARVIDRTLLRNLGGLEGILAAYLDDAVLSFPPQEQPLVRLALGALVGSSGVKQRLPLEAVARVATAEPNQVAAVLDTLTDKRLVRRYDVRQADATRIEYELVHDYLVAGIARWLGQAFWDQQKLRELVRQALPEWQARGFLPAPDVLRLAESLRGQVRFSQDELAMLYAAAVSFGADVSPWAGQVPQAARQDILRRLLAQPDAAVRCQAARQLAHEAAAPDGETLARLALLDPAPSVRVEAAVAIAEMSTEGHAPMAVNHLARAWHEPATRALASQALTTIRDRVPDSLDGLDAPLRRTVGGQVRALRWRRNRQRILADTLQGLQWGFIGTGLGFGLVWSLSTIQIPRDTGPGMAGALILVNVLIAGYIGAMSAGSGAFTRVTVRCLADFPHPWRTGALTAWVSAVFFWLAFAVIPLLNARAQQQDMWFLFFSLGALSVGLAVAASAVLPWRLPWPWHLSLTAIVGAASFVAVVALGLIASKALSPAESALIGAGTALGLYAGLNPRFWHRSSGKGGTAAAPGADEISPTEEEKHEG